MEVGPKFWKKNKRYRGGKPSGGVGKAPALPPVMTMQTMEPTTAKVGEAEARRVRKKTGRRATRITAPGLSMVPAPIATAGLKSKLGATV